MGVHVPLHNDRWGTPVLVGADDLNHRCCSWPSVPGCGNIRFNFYVLGNGRLAFRSVSANMLRLASLA